MKDKNKTKITKSIKNMGMIFRKFVRQGELFLNSLPLKKIVPIMKKTKNNNFLWIVFFVVKFIKNLKELTFVKKFNKLTKEHFSIINDNSRPIENKNFRKLSLPNLKENFLEKKVY